jgi:glycosidase
MSRIIYCIVFLLLLCSCGRDDDPTIHSSQTVGISVTDYTQYGSPFAGVPAAEDIIMYEVNLRAFSAEGDLQGVIDRLDHIQELGINTICLMPIYPQGELRSVGSPYTVRDYKAVSPEYGNLNDLRALTDQAHVRGMAVILDWVANHTAWDNDWIVNEDWYTQNNAGLIVHPPDTNWRDVVDLNFDNAEMRAEMIDAMRYWILEANVDGYRCDYADGVPADFWQEAFANLSSIPDRDLIFFAEGNRDDHFDAGFHLAFGWEFYGSIIDVYAGDDAATAFAKAQSEYSNVPMVKSM